MLVPTDEPFQPFTADELLARLQKGPLGDFQVHQTAHYLIFFQSSRAFAEASGRWLEDLYSDCSTRFANTRWRCTTRSFRSSP